MPVARQGGFSLMEVLIALAVLAIAMAALVKSAGGFTSNQAYLENKTIAHWVALNQLTTLRVENSRPSAGVLEGQEEMAGRIWNWQIHLSAAGVQEIMEAKVTVRQEDGETVYAMLTGLIWVDN